MTSHAIHLKILMAFGAGSRKNSSFKSYAISTDPKEPEQSRNGQSRRLAHPDFKTYYWATGNNRVRSRHRHRDTNIEGTEQRALRWNFPHMAKWSSAGCHSHLNEKGQSLSWKGLGRQGIHIQRRKPDPSLVPHPKINWRERMHLHRGLKIMKLREGNGRKTSWPWMWQWGLGHDTKKHRQQKPTRQTGPFQAYRLLALGRINQPSEKGAYRMGQGFAIQVSLKGFVRAYLARATPSWLKSHFVVCAVELKLTLPPRETYLKESLGNQ